MILRPTKRPDWFTLFDPDPMWVREYASVPGLQWTGNGSQVVAVTLHTSHLPLLPAGLFASSGCSLHTRAPKADTSILRPYQLEDLPFLLSHKGSLLAYEMRLGKTVTACMAHNPQDGILLVVGPLVSRDVWRGWIERIFGNPPFILQGRTNVELHPGYPAYFVHYDVLDAHTRFFAGERIGTLILDECHLLQNRKAKRVSAVSALLPHAAKIIGLSGTPMWSRPDSLYSVLHTLTPGAWGNHHDFALRYCGAEPGAHGWLYDSSSNEPELQARLREIMVRRTWKDVAPHLPPTTRVVEPVEVSAHQLAGIESATMHAALARGTSTVVGYLATLRRKLADVKIKAALATTQQALNDGHKVVLWVWHKDVGEKIAETMSVVGIPVCRIRSEDGAGVRELEVARFRDCPGPCVMVASIAVGGVAIDLSCSDYAIFAELDWTPAMVYQAEMRTFHPSRPHIVSYLYADVPVESKLVRALGVREGFQTSLGLGFDEVAKFVLDTAPSEAYDGNPFKE